MAGHEVSFQSTPQQVTPPSTIRFSTSDTVIVNELVTDLLKKGAIRPIRADKVAFLSNQFLVAKRGASKFRSVINLKALNRYIPDNKFKMEGWSEVKEAIFPNCYFARIDLQDAFLSINVRSREKYYRVIAQPRVHSEFRKIGLNPDPKDNFPGIRSRFRRHATFPFTRKARRNKKKH